VILKGDSDESDEARDDRQKQRREDTGTREIVANGKASRRKTRLGDRKRSEICRIKPKTKPGR
jgi:hypothetical protein